MVDGLFLVTLFGSSDSSAHEFMRGGDIHVWEVLTCGGDDPPKVKFFTYTKGLGRVGIVPSLNPPPPQI